MRTLLVEDDYITSQIMKEMLLRYGSCDVAENGLMAIEMFADAYNDDDPYDVIFLDIMMPEIDGQEVLYQIRDIETAKGIKGLDGVKIIMTTALGDFENIRKAFNNQCEGYLVKPVERKKMEKTLIGLGFDIFNKQNS